MKNKKRTKKPWNNTVSIHLEDESFVLTERDQNMLGKKSKYFKKIFSQSGHMWPEMRNRTVVLKEVSAENFKGMIKFLRYRRLRLHKLNILEISIMADRFLYEDLKNYCKRYILKKITIKNFLQMWSHAVRKLDPYHPNIIENRAKAIMGSYSLIFVCNNSDLKGVHYQVMYMYMTGVTLNFTELEVRAAQQILKWLNCQEQTSEIQDQCEFLLENAVEWGCFIKRGLKQLYLTHTNTFDKLLPNFSKHLEVCWTMLDIYSILFHISNFQQLKYLLDVIRTMRDCSPVNSDLFEIAEEKILKMTRFIRKKR